MKRKILVEREVDITLLRLMVPIPEKKQAAKEKDSVAIPHNIVGTWDVVIDIDKGTIPTWPRDTPMDIDFKVTDKGTYIVYNHGGKEMVRLEKKPIPHNLLPCKDGVLKLKIDNRGRITNWLSEPNLDDFF